MKVYKTMTRRPDRRDKTSHMKLGCDTKTRFIGIDQSLSCTGVVCCDLKMRVKLAYCIPTSPDLFNEARIDWIGMCISSLLRVHGCHLHFVALERPAYAAQGQRDVLHGVYWEIRRRVYKYDKTLDIKLVPISTWKKYVTGNGRASKALIRNSIEKRWGHTFNDENIYDAYGLLRYAADKWMKGDRV